MNLTRPGEGLPHARGGVSKTQRSVLKQRRSSPRPWGCFPLGASQTMKSRVFPTPVGVFPSGSGRTDCCCSLPHARGGVSLTAGFFHAITRSSPRPWGCFFLSAPILRPAPVFPTPVGVFPPDESFAQAVEGLPHARGGVSGQLGVGRCGVESSPRPWGCFRQRRQLSRRRVGLPHARGGVSSRAHTLTSIGLSSPRPWGCFFRFQRIHINGLVFPTPVGVFLAATGICRNSGRLPHARGGVSDSLQALRGRSPSSPRPWGCFTTILDVIV